MIENFIYKTESDQNLFWYENQKIELREYQKDLLFYWSGEQDKANYSLGDRTPEYEELPSIYNGGKFGSYSKVSSPLVFGKSNFEGLSGNLSLSFLVCTNSVNNYCETYLSKKGDWETLPEGTYSFNIQMVGEPSKTVTLNLKAGTTFSTLKNKLMFVLDPSIYNIEVDPSQTNTTTIALKAKINGRSFLILDGLESNNLLDYLDISEIFYGTTPTESTDLITLSNEASSLKITHTSSEENDRVYSKLKFVISQGEISKTTTINWNNNGTTFDHIEVDIDSSVMYVFLNGELLKAVLISPIVNNFKDSILTINGTDNNKYSYEEVIVKSNLQNKESFIPPTSQLTRYNTTRPYIDFYFSGSKIFEDSLTDLIVECSDNISMVLNYDGHFYYYSAGSWRTSDGSFFQSNDSYTFADYINNFTFTGKDNMFIRAYFDSDGNTPAWLKSIYFTLEESSIYGDGRTTAAILVGEREFEDEEEISLENKNLVIMTDQGNTTIDFNEDMTADEAVEYIKNLYPEGISLIKKDNLGRIVLISETKGDSSYIMVSGTAADTLFGNKKGEKGTDQTKETLEEDYAKFIESLKTYSTDDLIPIEINDDQIRLYLQEAINIYKKYRNDEENIYATTLIGNPTDGYDIPVVVGDWHDITDIIFKPLFPIGFYAGTFDNSTEDVIALTLVNAMCGQGGVNYGQFYGKGFVSDYYISLMNIESMEQTLGIKPSWRVYNNKLFIFPNSITKYLSVTIVYKAPVDPIKALRDPYIMQYVWGKIRMAQGEVRGQYGSQVSVSSIQVQFNGDTMYERGKEAVEKALEEMKRNQEPLGFLLG